MYGGSAWTKDTVRGQCYYHTYLPDEPDLNLNNEEVIKELEVIYVPVLGSNLPLRYVLQGPMIGNKTI